jgi:diguanylate cyclase (GGDEF)-like protein
MRLQAHASVPGRDYWLTIAPLPIAAVAMLVSLAGGPTTVCWNVAWTATAVSGVAGTLAARRRARLVNRRRWTLWAVATGLWLLGQLAWDLFSVVGFPRSPNVADACWWGFAVMLIVSMSAIQSGPRAARVVAAVERTALIAAALALCAAGLWADVNASPLDVAGKLSALAYPVLYGSATILVLQAVVGGALRGLNTPGLRLVLAGIGAQAVAFVLWSHQLLDATYVEGRTVLDPLWAFGLAAIGVGGLLAARVPEPVTVPEELNSRGGILPAGMFSVLLAALLVARIGGDGTGTTLTLELGLMFSGGALIARSALLGRRMRVMLDRERRALSVLAERESDLARLNAQLIEDSRRDPLTGISNRRALSDDLPMLESVHREQGESFAFALCDVDRFKRYNDRFGHLAGDQALRAIAATVRGALRGGDTAYRFGGEELLLVLRNTSAGDAVAIGERVRLAVQRAGMRHPDSEQGVLTVSVGVAAGGAEVGELLARADSALYEAKRGGRNRVVAASSQGAPSSNGRLRRSDTEAPVPRHLRSMLAVSRAAAAGQGPMPVLEALAEAIHTEMSFQVVAVNLLDEERGQLGVVVVHGNHEARETLLGTSSPWSEWRDVIEAGRDICGAIWLEAGSYEWNTETPTWTPRGVPSLSTDDWHPEDMLLLPLRGGDGKILGVVSVDEPLLGRRPTEAELSVLMGVADHAGLALEQAQRDDGEASTQSRELRLAAVTLLAEMLDMRDPSTARHSRTVGEYARQTALALDLSPDRVDRIHAAGLVHDLGKLGVPDAILYKAGPLDEHEWREIRRHPDLGAQILEHAGLRDIAAWVQAHHERVDGRGYPAGLSDERISLEARILAVADAYEAMVADRPYRSGMAPADAREELLRCAGSQFDAVVVEAFLTALDGEVGVRTPVVQRVA